MSRAGLAAQFKIEDSSHTQQLIYVKASLVIQWPPADRRFHRAKIRTQAAVCRCRTSAEEIGRELHIPPLLFNQGITVMKHLLPIIAVMTVLGATSASAQSINLTGVFRCIQMCRGDLPAYVTQNGPELNLLTEAGVPSRAWPDWYSPTTRIWVDAFNESAVYSPDGMLIQFDNGTIWQRNLPLPPPELRNRY